MCKQLESPRPSRLAARRVLARQSILWSALLLVLALALSACNVSDSAKPITKPKHNNEENNEPVNNEPGDDPGIAAHANCAAAGEASGDGIVALNCLGPSEPGGFEARGGGIVWQPGASRVVMQK